MNDTPTISIIIPTLNRAYALMKVADSYYIQKYVTEIIFVDDCGEDNTKEIVKDFSIKYPTILTKYLRHEKRKGAAAARTTGFLNAQNDYVLFCDDDEFLQNNYTEVCYEKLTTYKNIGAVSGRNIYRLPNENIDDAIKRFGFGKDNIPLFDFQGFVFNNDAFFSGDVYLPLTNAIILTKKKLLLEYGYDEYYTRGNGYREESDYQANICTNGYQILVTNDTHSVHLHHTEVKSGGQRVGKILQLYFNIVYTNYFYDKYYDRYKIKFQLKTNISLAKLISAWYQFKNILFYPFIKLLLRNK